MLILCHGVEVFTSWYRAHVYFKAWCGSVTSWYRVDVYFMPWCVHLLHCNMYGVDVYFMAGCVGIYFIVNVICVGWMFILWLGVWAFTSL